MIGVDVISDPICPWCYIGKARLDAATVAAGRNPFELRWRPFQLNPDMPAGGRDRKEYLAWKFGGEASAARFYATIEQTALEAGLEVDFARIKRTPNTFDAHRLIRWSHAAGAQNAVVMQLFRRYFEAGEDIGDRDLLLDVAATAGMERALVRRLLTGDADAEDVRREEAAARAMGVGGVPTFILGRKYVMTGAQETATWAKVLEELAAAA